MIWDSCWFTLQNRVAVWKLDRLTRNLKEGANVLADWCQRGVRVIAVTQQIDLSGSVGQVIASLLFGVAEIELQHAEERQAWDRPGQKTRCVYRTTARALKKQGLAIGEIAKALGVKERTVCFYLRQS